MRHTGLVMHGKVGTPGEFSALAQTVGLPLGIAAKLLLGGKHVHNYSSLFVGRGMMAVQGLSKSLSRSLRTTNVYLARVLSCKQLNRLGSV